MHILFYGGCHAVALETLFRSAATGGHRFSSLENYKLINARTPFPYERLRGVDAVVFSPIRNQGEWNTEHLVARCAALGIRTLSFPWLQWNGYFPDVMKVEGHPPHLWGYQRLRHFAGEGWSEARLLAEARDRDVFNPLPYADWAFSALEEHEAGTDLPISPFIRANFRHTRLFWTPDHPTLPLYRDVMARIAERLGIALDPTIHLGEQHPDSFIILPGVRDTLQLAFDGGEYRPAEWARGVGIEKFIALTAELYGPVPAK